MPETLGSESSTGYKDAFAILDALAVQLSGGAYNGRAKDTLEPSVANVRSV